MVTKEELEKSTFIGRNSNVWFMTAWALMMFIIDGVVYAVDPPPGESKWGYGPTVFLLCLVRESLHLFACSLCSSTCNGPRQLSLKGLPFLASWEKGEDRDQLRQNSTKHLQ